MIYNTICISNQEFFFFWGGASDKISMIFIDFINCVMFQVMEYEHDSANENLYRTSFIKAFKKKILENYFSFYIIDAINNKVTYYKDILEISRINGFTVSSKYFGIWYYVFFFLLYLNILTKMY